MTFIKKPLPWLIASLATIVISFAIIFAAGLNWGIDFVGGSLLEIEAPDNARNNIEQLLRQEFNLPTTIQATQDDSLIIRTNTISEEQHQQIVTRLQETGLMTGQERRFESIGPTIGQELRRNSLSAISLVVALIIIYLAYTFRGMKGLVAPWKLGVAAVYALLHDLVVVTALFAIFGKLWDAPVDTLFVTAQLAIMGYSVNDTIVIFDRMRREWLTNKRSTRLLDVMNHAISDTLGRSLNTAFTTLLVLIALLVFGGSTIRWFIVALTAGTITGTYSTIFVAPPLLHYLTKKRG